MKSDSLRKRLQRVAPVVLYKDTEGGGECVDLFPEGLTAHHFSEDTPPIYFESTVPESIRRGISSTRLDPALKRMVEGRILSVVIGLKSGRLDTEQGVSEFLSFFTPAAEEAYLTGTWSVERNTVLSSLDHIAVAAYLALQSGFFRRYADQLTEVTTRTVRSKSYTDSRRAALYANSLDGLYLEGALSRLRERNANKSLVERTIMVTWRLHPAEHCQSCLDLAEGSPYLPRDLHTVPRGGQTECMMNCKCSLTVHSKLSGHFRRTLSRITGRS